MPEYAQRLLLFFVALLVVANAARAQSDPGHRPASTAPMLLSSNESVNLLETGRDDLFAFRLREAEARFTTLANRPDGRAAGMYYLASVSFLRYVMSDRDSDMEEFVLRSDELRQTLEREPDTPWRHLLGAETNMQRAVVWAKQGRYVRAALSGRSAYLTYQALVDEDPGMHEALKGFGLVKVAIASLPRTYRRFLAVAGFSGDIDVGMSSLRVAAKSGGYMAEESTICLALFALMLDGVDGQAETRLRELRGAHPDSPLFAHLLGYYLLEERRAAEAETEFRAAASNYGNPDVFYIDYVDYFLGLSLFRQNRFESAASYFDRYRRNHEGAALMAPTMLHLGLALEMTGRRQDAESVYRDVSATREFEADHVSRRRAERLVRQPMTATERRLLRGANAFDAGNHDEAHTHLQAAAEDSNADVSVQAEAAYRLGRLRHEEGDYELALTHYAEAVRIRGDEFDRWAPWAEYQAGEVHAELGNLQAASAAYTRALSYEGSYDYFQALENSVRLAMTALSRES